MPKGVAPTVGHFPPTLVLTDTEINDLRQRSRALVTSSEKHMNGSLAVRNSGEGAGFRSEL